MTAYQTWLLSRRGESGGPKYTAEQRHAIKRYAVTMSQQGTVSDPEGWVYVAARDDLVDVLSEDYWALSEHVATLIDAGYYGLPLYYRLCK